MGLFTPGKVHAVAIMGFDDERLEELKQILWDSGLVSDENTLTTIVDILEWERKGRANMPTLGTEERAKELMVILRRHSVAEGAQAELFIDDVLDWHARRTLGLGDRIDELEQAMRWFCKRSTDGYVRIELTFAVFRMLLAENEDSKELWEARAKVLAIERKKLGYPRLEWDWEIDE